MHRIVGLSFCCLAVVFLWACEKKSEYTGPPPPHVTVSQPVRKDIVKYHEITGNTQGVNTVQLRARVEGYLDRVYFNDGDFVKKDQLLFMIQQNTYIAQLMQAEGNVLAQKALLEHARIEYDRYSNLLKQRAAAATDVENWRYQRDSAQAGLITAEAQRDLAKLNFGYTWVVAPFSGRIDRRQVDPGNLVGTAGSSTVLAEITQTDPLYVYFNVSESDLTTIVASFGLLEAQRTGYPAYVGIANEEGYPHKGHLDFASTTVSTSTGTLLVRAVIPNGEGKLFPGQFARVRVPVGTQTQAILVPKVAVGFDQIGAYVLIVNEKNTVERRNVKTGFPEDSMYVIADGLTGNEWVIVKGLLRAAPGRQVAPDREPAAQQQATSERQGG